MESTQDTGYWAPLTMEGTLLVDGFLASCYASFPHIPSQLVLAPVKLLPQLLLDNEESQHQDGVREVVKMLKGLGRMLGLRRKDNKDGQEMNQPCCDQAMLGAMMGVKNEL